MQPKPCFPHWLGLIVLFVVPQETQAQWEDVSVDYLLDATTLGSVFGCGLSTADFDSDGWDDVTTAGSDGWVRLYSGGETGFTLEDEWQLPNEIKAVLWVDIENDGDLDLFVGVYHLGMFLYVRQADGTLSEQGLARGFPTLQSWDVRGFSARDYDRDGDLDLYVTSYHDDSQSIVYENMLFQNGGNGYFEDVTLISGVGNGLKHSFQAAWMDFDGNGFDDLWVINDRAIFPNALYLNSGTGTFIDFSFESGAGIGVEAMTATLFDPDNDGDWDQYVTNIEGVPNYFLKNNAGVYENIAESAGVASLQYSWGTCAIDVDGDRWDDMMVATYRFPNSNPYDNHMYMNLGTGLEFSDETDSWPNEQFQLYCLGRMDLDQDRAPDLVGHGNASYAQVLRNTNSEGARRMTVELVGTLSNTRAVGSVIKVHADGLTQMRQVDAGVDYMTQHTYRRFFGLGDVAVVDSIEVFWPMGDREVLFDIASDTALVIVEGTANAQMEWVPLDCPWSAQGWLVPFDPAVTDMTWNGVPVTGDTVFADSSGAWTLEAEWWGGGVTWSETVVWESVPEPELSISVVPPPCPGTPGLVSWSMPGGAVVWGPENVWSDTLDNEPFTVGNYPLLVEWGDGCFLEADFEVVAPDSLMVAVVVEQPNCFGDVGSAEVTATGGTPPLTVEFPSGNAGALPQGIWPFYVVDSMGCQLSDSITIIEPDTLISSAEFNYLGVTDSAWVELNVSGGTPPYWVTWSGPLDSAGWAAAPVNLGWFVEDANGCLDIGVLEIASNPLSDIQEYGENGEWRCWKQPLGLQFNGPVGGEISVEVFDLSGRRLMEVGDVRKGSVLRGHFPDVVLIVGKDEWGNVSRWLLN
jgi:hypothetical protein